MKHLMWGYGADPWVIPNGIPRRMLKPVAPNKRRTLRQILDPDSDAAILFKMGRFDPAKRWLMAMFESSGAGNPCSDCHCSLEP